MTIDQAEVLLSELRTRENAKLAGMVREWDEAYAVAYGAYRRGGSATSQGRYSVNDKSWGVWLEREEPMLATTAAFMTDEKDELLRVTREEAEQLAKAAETRPGTTATVCRVDS